MYLYLFKKIYIVTRAYSLGDQEYVGKKKIYKNKIEKLF